MKNFKAAIIVTTVLTNLASPSLSWSVPPVGGEDHRTERSPCPFLNALNLGPNPTIGDLINAAEPLGANSTLMRTLARVVAEAGPELATRKVEMHKLLDSNRRPAHNGSLAREDGKLNQVDTSRLSHLPEYDIDGKISFDGLKRYQAYCWGLSKHMGVVDRAIGDAELQLLWSLFGEYRVNEDGVETIPLILVQNFLERNELPSDFIANKKDPATIGSLIISIIEQAMSCHH